MNILTTLVSVSLVLVSVSQDFVGLGLGLTNIPGIGY